MLSRKHLNSFIKEEYRILLKETPKNKYYCNHVSSVEEENKSKNRYNDVLPEEKTRVKLLMNKDNPHSDYINANFVYNRFIPSDKTYICSQAPLPSTFNDFWRMIWEQKVGSIVTLIKLKEKGRIKGDRYWPQKKGKKFAQIYGNLEVMLKSSLSLEDRQLILNIFKISNGKESRILAQFYFRGWSDFGVPDSTLPIRSLIHLVNFFHKISSLPKVSLIHCSAGIGRTGTYLAIEMALDYLKAHNVLKCNNEDELMYGSSIESNTLEYEENELNNEHSSDEYDYNVSDESSEDFFTGSEENDDSPIELPKHVKLPPIKKIVLSLREQRNRGMVQTEEQYKFIYRAVIDEINYGKPRISSTILKFIKNCIKNKIDD